MLVGLVWVKCICLFCEKMLVLMVFEWGFVEELVFDGEVVDKVFEMVKEVVLMLVVVVCMVKEVVNVIVYVLYKVMCFVDVD